MRTRLRHRIPVPLRHHWRLLALAVALLVLTTGVLGAVRVRPVVLTDADADDRKSTVDIPGTVDLFDATVPHTVTVAFAAKDYDDMVTAFLAGGDKDYVPADLVIDGTPVPRAGIRLKGNSTLMALRRGTNRGLGPTLSTERPEELPWLINLDHFVEGRRYQGHETLAVRPAGRSGSTLNEALGLTLVGLAGEPTQRYAFSSFAVNGRPLTTRLLVEVPDHTYASALGRGVLYKALSTSLFSWQGESPTAYTDDFDQINRKGSQDLQPVMNLIRWVEQSSDADFARDLDQHVDVASFARYAALQNLLLNFDDMAGPGKNYYLFYDLDRTRFRVITWDLNLAFGGDPAQGPFDPGRLGGRGPVGAVPAPGPGPGPGFVGGFRTGNKLKERFLALFRPVYEATYKQLYQQLFANGSAMRALDTVAAQAGPTEAAAAQTLRTTINARTRALASVVR